MLACGMFAVVFDPSLTIAHLTVHYENSLFSIWYDHQAVILMQQNNIFRAIIPTNNTTFNSENAILALQLAFWCLTSIF